MRPYSPIVDRLRDAGLRPTRQRLALAKLLFNGGHRHVTAESLHADVIGTGVRVSLATVYNTLHQFTTANLLKEVSVDGARSYFDTNTSVHYHYFHTDTGVLEDIPGDRITLAEAPDSPPGMVIEGVDVIVRVRKSDA